MSPNLPNIYSGVGAVASVMSKFVFPSKPICDNYPNLLKNDKLHGDILVEWDVKVVWQGANAIPDFVFTHADFSEQIFLCRQSINPCDPIGYSRKHLCLSRGSCTCCRQWRHRWSVSWWKQSYWWYRSKKSLKFNIGLYVESTFGRHGGAFPPRDCYRWW